VVPVPPGRLGHRRQHRRTEGIEYHICSSRKPIMDGTCSTPKCTETPVSLWAAAVREYSIISRNYGIAMFFDFLVLPLLPQQCSPGLANRHTRTSRAHHRPCDTLNHSPARRMELSESTLRSGHVGGHDRSRRKLCRILSVRLTHRADAVQIRPENREIGD